MLDWRTAGTVVWVPNPVTGAKRVGVVVERKGAMAHALVKQRRGDAWDRESVHATRLVPLRREEVARLDADALKRWTDDLLPMVPRRLWELTVRNLRTLGWMG